MKPACLHEKTAILLKNWSTLLTVRILSYGALEKFREQLKSLSYFQ